MMIIALMAMGSIPFQMAASSHGPTVPFDGGAPVILIGEEEFEDWASLMGCPGSGTEGDPYIIDDMTIDANATEDCLYMEDIDLHILITNCTFVNASRTGFGQHLGSGLCLVGCSNMTVENISASSCRFGLRISGSSNIQVVGSNLSDNFNSGVKLITCTDIDLAGNDVAKNDFGISSEDCVNCTFKRNRCADNDDHGIRLDTCTDCEISDNEMTRNDDGVHLVLGSDDNIVENNRISESREYSIYMDDSIRVNCSGNIMVNCSFMIEADTLAHQTIDETNMVNGGPVVYIDGKDGAGATLGKGGQLLLSGSKNYTFVDLDISNGSAGILMAYCSLISIKNITIDHETYFGIKADRCTKITLSNSSVNDCNRAFDIMNSNTRVFDSVFEDSIYGIDARFGEEIEIHNCSFSSVNVPINVVGSISLIEDCHVIGGYTGISIADSPSVSVRDTRIHQVQYGMNIVGSDMIGISNCSILDTGFDGIVCRNIADGSNITIDHCVFRSVGWSGILFKSSDLAISSVARVMANDFLYCGRSGVEISNAAGIDVLDNRFIDCQRGIILETWVEKVLVDRNEFVNCSIDCDERVVKGETIDVTMDNTLNGLPMIYLIERRNIVLDLPIAVGQVFLAGCVDVVLNGISISGSEFGFEIKRSLSVRVTDMNATECPVGIRVRGSSDMTIEDCRISECDLGVLINASDICRISGSNISGNGFGIEIEGSPKSRDIRISDNVILNNSNYALNSDKWSRGIVVENNLFAFNHGSGRTYDPNAVQAFDAGYITWRGNYWLDHVDTPVGPETMDDPYHIDGRGNADDTPMRRIPASILPPPDSATTIALGWGSHMDVDWDPVDDRSMLPVTGYSVYTGNKMSPVQVAVMGPDTTLWSTEEDGAGEGVILSTVSEYGESVHSPMKEILTDPIDPTVQVQLGPLTYYQQASITMPFSVWDDDIAGSVDVSLDGEPGASWPDEDGSLISLDLEMMGTLDKDNGTLTFFTLTAADLSEDAHDIRVDAVGMNGNTGSWNGTIVIDLTPPTVGFEAPEEGSVHEGPAVNITWSCDDRSGIEMQTLSINDGPSTGIDTDIGYHVASLEDGELVRGENHARIEVMDRAGHTASALLSFNLSGRSAGIDAFYPTGSGVPIDTNITVRFSDLVNFESLEITLKDRKDDFYFPLNVSFDDDRKGFAASHPRMDPDTEYVVHVLIDDAWGHSIGKNWTFITGSEWPENDTFNITGLVKERGGGPLDQVDLMMNGTVVASTDKYGHFLLQFKKGDHYIIFSKDGYKDLGYHLSLYPLSDLGSDRDIGTIEMERTDEKGGTNVYFVIGMASTVALAVVAILIFSRRGRSKDTLEE
jgi:parallel beta-helix repeat protein